MEAVKKYWLWGIFISILTVFAMSYNVNAVEPVYDLSNYDIYNYYDLNTISCLIGGGSDSVLNGYSCSTRISGETKFYEIKTDTTFNLKKDDIITFYIFLRSTTNGFTYSPIVPYYGNGNLNYQLVDFREVDAENFDTSLYSFNGYVNPAPNNDLNVDFNTTFGFTRVYQVTLKSLRDMTNNIYLRGSNNSSACLFLFNADDTMQTVRLSLSNLTFYRRAESQENREQEEKTQEAADASETAGGDSSSDAQTGTTSLINAITGAVTVISSASPTNCKINGNMGNLDIGQLDLCANPAPAFVTTIGSLILILMCVPLAIKLFNRFISLFRSFQS